MTYENTSLFIKASLEIIMELWEAPKGKRFSILSFYKSELENKNDLIISYAELTKVINGKSSKELTLNVVKWLRRFLEKKYKIGFNSAEKKFIRNGSLYRAIKPEKGLDHFYDFGLKKVFHEIPKEEIIAALPQCKSIRICDTRLPEWILPALKEAINKNVKVKVMILSPESDVCDLRSKSLRDFTLNEIRLNVMTCLSYFINEDFLEKNFEVVLLKEIPTLNAYIVDDKIWMGGYPYNQSSEHSPYFGIESGSNTLSSFVNTQFSQLMIGYEEDKPLSKIKLKEIVSFCENDLDTRSATRVLSFVGTYNIYYTEGLTKIKELKESKIIKPIGVNILEIKEEKGEYEVIMKTSYDLKGKRSFRGKVDLNTGKSSLLVFNMSAPDSYVNFIFHHSGNAIEGEPIFGSYNISYYRGNGNGVGKAVLVKTSKQFHDLKPTSLNPLKKYRSVHDKMIKYLMFQHESVLRPAMRKELLSRNTKFAGNYLVYSNNKKDGKRFISVGIIKIFPSGYVLYKHMRKEKDGNSEGYIKIIGNALQVLVFNKKSDLNGYFIVETLDNPPNEDRIYSGVFAGVSYRDKKPMTSRIIWELVNEDYDKFKPFKAEFFTSKMAKVPEEVQVSLSGRTGNTTGYFRYRSILNFTNLQEQNKKEVDYSEVFYDSAVLKAHKGEIDQSIKMLRRSLEHDISIISLEKFKAELEKNGLIKKENAQKIKQHKKYKELVEAFGE